MKTDKYIKERISWN